MKENENLNPSTILSENKKPEGNQAIKDRFLVVENDRTSQGPLNDLPCFNLYSSWRDMNNLYKSRLGMDVTPQKVYVLKTLNTVKSLTMNELSRALHLDSSAVSTLISRFEKKGLVIRTHCTQDRRTVHVALTEEGKLECIKMEDPINEMNDFIDKSFSSIEKNALQGVTSKLIAMNSGQQ